MPHTPRVACPGPRGLATAAALAEMAGDKMPFAPDRRIAPSFLVRLALGAVGGAALAGRGASGRSAGVCRAGLIGYGMDWAWQWTGACPGYCHRRHGAPAPSALAAS